MGAKMQGWQVAPPIEKYYNLFRQACQFPYNLPLTADSIVWDELWLVVICI